MMTCVVKTPIAPTSFFTSKAEVVGINYNLKKLRIHVALEGLPGLCRVDFLDIFGFRVLDETDIFNFYLEKENCSWAYRIESGGWLDFEKFRPDWIGGSVDSACEFFISGVNECVNVIAFSPPEFTTQTSNDAAAS